MVGKREWKWEQKKHMNEDLIQAYQSSQHVEMGVHYILYLKQQPHSSFVEQEENRLIKGLLEE